MLLLLSTLFLGGGVTVTLPMEAHVRGTEIELSEIAELTGDDPALVERIGKIELGYAPSPGYSRLILAEKVRAAVTQKAPGVEVFVVGQRACRVHPEVEEIPSAELSATALLELQKRFGASDASFELSGALPRVVVPAGTESHRLVARVPGSELRAGTINVPIDVLVEGVRYRTIWTTWNAEVWETKLVLTREVRAGEVLGAELFERRRVLLLPGPGEKPLDGARLLGAVAARDLAAGEVVGSMDVHRPTIVTLGDGIFLRVRKGAIEARVSALALESGSVGDRIRVRNAASGQELTALVLSRDLCAVDLGQ